MINYRRSSITVHVRVNQLHCIVNLTNTIDVVNWSYNNKAMSFHISPIFKSVCIGKINRSVSCGRCNYNYVMHAVCTLTLSKLLHVQ